MPWTALLTCCYMDNFATMWHYQRQPDGTRVWSDNLGAKPLGTHAVEDVGGSAAGCRSTSAVASAESWLCMKCRKNKAPWHCSHASGGIIGSTAALALILLPYKICPCVLLYCMLHVHALFILPRRSVPVCCYIFCCMCTPNAPDTLMSGAPVIFADPAKYTGKTIPVVRERLSWPDAAQILTEVTGIPVRCACR